MILGIDPGCSGAIVVLKENGEYVDHILMPTIKDGKQTKLNCAAIVAKMVEINRNEKITHAYIEKVHSMPKQGVTAVFTFGHAAGAIEGIIQGMLIPYTLVTPQAWKKSAGLIGLDKDAARSRAIQLYPTIRALDKKAQGQAISDAILIARHGASIKE